MGYASELIRAAREHSKLDSDAALAARLKVSAPTLNQWKNEVVPLAEKRVLQLATLAGIDPVLATVEYRLATETDDLVRNHLEQMHQRLLSAPGAEAYLRAGRTVIAYRPGAADKRAGERFRSRIRNTLGAFLLLGATHLPTPATAAATAVLERSAHNSVSYVRVSRRRRRRGPRYFPGYPAVA